MVARMSEKIVLSPDWQPFAREQGLDRVAGVFGRTDGVVVTSSGSTEVRRLEPGGGTARHTIFVKKYWIRGARDLWRGVFRGTLLGRPKVRREYANLVRLRELGLDAPAALAWGAERRAGFVVRSFLVSEGVADPVPLDQYIRHFLPACPPEEQRRRRAALLRQLAASTRRMHQGRFVHHDYYWRNIILSGSSFEHFWLIDSHKGNVWRPWAGHRSRAKDLATLDAPAPQFFRRTDRLRFLLAYLDEERLTPRARRLIRSILRIAQPLRSRELRRVLGGPAPEPGTPNALAVRPGSSGRVRLPSEDSNAQ